MRLYFLDEHPMTPDPPAWGFLESFISLNSRNPKLAEAMGWSETPVASAVTTFATRCRGTDTNFPHMLNVMFCPVSCSSGMFSLLGEPEQDETQMAVAMTAPAQ